MQTRFNYPSLYFSDCRSRLFRVLANGLFLPNGHRCWSWNSKTAALARLTEKDMHGNDRDRVGSSRRRGDFPSVSIE